MKGDNIADRLLLFAKRVLKLCEELPNTFAAKHIAKQVIRSASSGGSNYEEARGSQSLADFVHKMSISRKEICESRYWLRLAHPEIADGREIVALIREANELASILTASIRTARQRLEK